MDVETNPFCAAGMHLPNGSFATFGGNNAVGPGGVNSDPGSTTSYDPTYKDHRGTRAIRIISPCTGDLSSPQCSWYDSPNGLQMAKSRWYPGAEALADGTVVLIGGFTWGGYINRNYPNIDPENEGGAAQPTYEFFPSRPQPLQVMNFMVNTSGLNSYALTYLMPSGKMFVQANYSTSEVDVIFHLVSFADYNQFSGIIMLMSKRPYLTCLGRLLEYTLRREQMPCYL